MFVLRYIRDHAILTCKVGEFGNNPFFQKYKIKFTCPLLLGYKAHDYQTQMEVVATFHINVGALEDLVLKTNVVLVHMEINPQSKVDGF